MHHARIAAIGLETSAPEGGGGLDGIGELLGMGRFQWENGAEGALAGVGLLTAMADPVAAAPIIGEMITVDAPPDWPTEPVVGDPAWDAAPLVPPLEC